MSLEGIQSRRGIFAPLRTPPPTANAGLWIEKYAKALGGTGSPKEHFETLFSVLPDGRHRAPDLPAAYSAFFHRWRDHLGMLPPATIFARASASGRLAVGLGAESTLETSIALHHTYGVPYLPGSALKGLAAHAARERLDPAWNPEDPTGPYNVVFGRLEEAGFVTFHDALWIPEGNDPRLPLDLDVMTVHHGDYYGAGKTPPTDWDDPNPIPFLSARGSYLLALTGPPGWIEKALEILTGALAEDGLGAKTAAGYGRMKVTREEGVGR
ncbi:MAG: type III-B CRISPR module RAMP protein Cmr6 [Acidobacteriota bacterium]